MLANLGEPLCINQSFENLSNLGMTVPGFILEERRCLKGVALSVKKQPQKNSFWMTLSSFK